MKVLEILPHNCIESIRDREQRIYRLCNVEDSRIFHIFDMYETPSNWVNLRQVNTYLRTRYFDK